MRTEGRLLLRHREEMFREGQLLGMSQRREELCGYFLKCREMPVLCKMSYVHIKNGTITAWCVCLYG